MSVDGNTSFEGNVTVETDVTVEGNLDIDGTMDANILDVETIATIDGQLTAGTIRTPEITSNEIHVENLTVDGSSATILNNVTISGDANITGALVADDITANEVVLSSDTSIDTQSVNVSGAVQAQDLTTSGSIIINNADLAVTGNITCNNGSC